MKGKLLADMLSILRSEKRDKTANGSSGIGDSETSILRARKFDYQELYICVYYKIKSGIIEL